MLKKKRRGKSDAAFKPGLRSMDSALSKKKSQRRGGERSLGKENSKRGDAEEEKLCGRRPFTVDHVRRTCS